MTLSSFLRNLLFVAVASVLLLPVVVVVYVLLQDSAEIPMRAQSLADVSGAVAYWQREIVVIGVGLFLLLFPATISAAWRAFVVCSLVALSVLGGLASLAWFGIAAWGFTPAGAHTFQILTEILVAGGPLLWFAFLMACSNRLSRGTRVDFSYP